MFRLVLYFYFLKYAFGLILDAKLRKAAVVSLVFLPSLTLAESKVASDNSWHELKWVAINRGDFKASDSNMPFFPHRAQTKSGGVLDFHDFESSQICSACHVDIYNQWRQSMMAYSWDDPIYRGLLKMASEATGGQLNNFCTGCHSPVGLTSGQIDNSTVRTLTDDESRILPGVDCDACHTLTARTGMDNGAYVLSPNSASPIKFGPRRDAVSPYHRTSFSPLHTQSTICATCHNVTHPFNNVPIERTYDEWLESPYAKEDVQCQDCHMRGFQGRAAIMGPEREEVAGHRFEGANSTVLSHFGETEQANRAREMLRSAARLDWLSPPEFVPPGETGEFSLRVMNTGAGHKLPTGFPEGREVWLEVTVLDASNAKIYQTGAVKNGKTEPGTRNYKVHLGDKDGREVDLEVWNVTHVISDNRILPRGFATEEFQFSVPASARYPLTVDIKLNYWPFSQALVDRILGEESIPVDIVQMAHLTHTIVEPALAKIVQ